MLLTNFERLFDPFLDFYEFPRRFRGRRPDFPPYNVWLSDDKAIITTELPGITPSDIDLSVVGKVVTLKGERKADELKEGESYHRRERWYGRFNKSIELPYNIESNGVKATFQKGILTIELPRAEAEKPKKIEIKTE
ncbi:MAG: Hsp20/alpha crystallin family protein [Thermodesulfovibrionales bacterium]|nr:Hsp20/alpha crystallin family protein [Thermodesulfovibrionales bacterium]